MLNFKEDGLVIIVALMYDHANWSLSENRDWQGKRRCRHQLHT